MPGVFMSTSSRLMPLCFGASGSVRQSRKHQSAMSAWLVHTFWPLTTYVVAVALAAACAAPPRSEPAPGSEKPWHHSSSPDTSGARKRSLLRLACRAAGAPGRSGRRSDCAGGPRRADRSSAWSKNQRSTTVAPRPPCSRGHEMAAQPPSKSCCCHSRAISDPHRVLDARPAVIAPPAAGRLRSSQRARLVGEGQIGGGEREVHARRNLAERPVD